MRYLPHRKYEQAKFKESVKELREYLLLKTFRTDFPMQYMSDYILQLWNTITTNKAI